jgi:hypothetical protein
MSFMTGFFSEYLTIFFEISEIFLGFSFLFFAFIKKNTTTQKSFLFLLLGFFLSLEVASIFAVEQKLAFLGALKVFEAFLAGVFIYSSKYPFKNIAWILFCVALFQGALGVTQFIIGHSAGLGFVREQSLNAIDAGMPKFADHLRASGTFLHPNILSFFLVLSFFLGDFIKKPWFYLRYLLIIPIVLTFSRTGILALFCGLLFKKKDFLWALLLILLFLIYAPVRELLMERLVLGDSLTERLGGFDDAFFIIRDYPWGVGVRNYILYLQDIAPWSMQPVHSLFLLISAEVGVLAGVVMFLFFVLAFIKNKAQRSLIMVFFVFGLFDHFLWSIYTGLMLLAIFMGLFFRKEEHGLLKKFFI